TVTEGSARRWPGARPTRAIGASPATQCTPREGAGQRSSSARLGASTGGGSWSRALRKMPHAIPCGRLDHPSQWLHETGCAAVCAALPASRSRDSCARGTPGIESNLKLSQLPLRERPPHPLQPFGEERARTREVEPREPPA